MAWRSRLVSRLPWGGWVALSTLGLAALFAAVPGALFAMKLLGGGYLIVLTARAMRAAWRPDAGAAVRAARAPSLWAAFARGMLVNLTNPKSGLMWVTVATAVFGAGPAHWQALLFAPLGAVSALGVYAFCAVLFATGRARRVDGRFRLSFEAGALQRSASV